MAEYISVYKSHWHANTAYGCLQYPYLHFKSTRRISKMVNEFNDQKYDSCLVYVIMYMHKCVELLAKFIHNVYVIMCIILWENLNVLCSVHDTHYHHQ